MASLPLFLSDKTQLYEQEFSSYMVRRTLDFAHFSQAQRPHPFASGVLIRLAKGTECDALS